MPEPGDPSLIRPLGEYSLEGLLVDPLEALLVAPGDYDCLFLKEMPYF